MCVRVRVCSRVHAPGLRAPGAAAPLALGLHPLPPSALPQAPRDLRTPAAPLPLVTTPVTPPSTSKPTEPGHGDQPCGRAAPPAALLGGRRKADAPPRRAEEGGPQPCRPTASRGPRWVDAGRTSPGQQRPLVAAPLRTPGPKPSLSRAQPPGRTHSLPSEWGELCAQKAGSQPYPGTVGGTLLGNRASGNPPPLCWEFPTRVRKFEVGFG